VRLKEIESFTKKKNERRFGTLIARQGSNAGSKGKSIPISGNALYPSWKANRSQQLYKTEQLNLAVQGLNKKRCTKIDSTIAKTP
jgi:hypothetical protein